MIPDKIIKDFKRIGQHIEGGVPLSLMECRRKSSGETVYLICMNYPEPGSDEFGIFPIAELIVHPKSGTTRDAVDLYDPPKTDGGFGLDEDMELGARLVNPDAS